MKNQFNIRIKWIRGKYKNITAPFTDNLDIRSALKLLKKLNSKNHNTKYIFYIKNQLSRRHVKR